MKKSTDSIEQLSNLVDTGDPKAVLREVKIIVSSIYPEFNYLLFDRVFFDIVRLFKGEYEGFRKCTTEYHDLRHTMGTLLTLARLLHGSFKNDVRINEKYVFLGLVSALMHDTGYIQSNDDRLGTGAKYMREHVIRSLLYMEKYFSKNGFSLADFNFCRKCITTTEINANINAIDFAAHEEEVAGKMLGTSDLLSQMADRNYLEKLLFLYYEFREGSILGYESELDLLKKTLALYTSTMERITVDMGNYNKYMADHFRERWNIDKDLYSTAIEKNITYLKFILETHEKDYRSYLRRGNVVNTLYRENEARTGL